MQYSASNLSSTKISIRCRILISVYCPEIFIAENQISRPKALGSTANVFRRIHYSKY